MTVVAWVLVAGIAICLILCLTAVVKAWKEGFSVKWIAVFVLGLGGLFLIYLGYNLNKIEPADQAIIMLTAGLVAVTGLYALSAARQADASVKMAEEMREQGGRIPGDVIIASSPTEAVREADVICTATTSKTPVFADADLKAGVHINAIGAFTPEMQEVPEDTIKRAQLVVDSREACWAEAGDLIIPRHKGLISESDIYAELGEIAAGTKRGRESDEEMTFFKSVGNAVQDVSVARKVLEEAGRLGLGLEVEL